MVSFMCKSNDATRVCIPNCEGTISNIDDDIPRLELYGENLSPKRLIVMLALKVTKCGI